MKLDPEGPAGCNQSGEEIRRGCRWDLSLLEVSLEKHTLWDEANEQDRILFIGSTSRLAWGTHLFLRLEIGNIYKLPGFCWEEVS